jgi:5,10-methylenetetrahydromethanopterin reductase
MGASPVPCTRIGDLARAMEAGGWDGLALGEAHALLPDPYVALALAAAATTTLKVGTAVAVPLRHPLLAADAMATVQAVADGRASFSIGRGDGAVKVLQRRPLRVAEFESYLGQLQGFLRREEVEIDGAVATMARLDAIDPGLDLPPPPVHVAATGPRMINVATRWADGVSFAVGADTDRLRDCIELARQACDAVGRDPGGLTLGCFVQAAVCDDDERDRERARDAIRGLVITHSRFSGFDGRALPGVASNDQRPIRRSLEEMEGVLRSTRGGISRRPGGAPGELDFYPSDAVDDAFVDRFGIIGSAEHCAQRLKEILNLGITRIYIGTRAVGVDLEERNTLRLGHEVLPLLRRAPSPT